MNTHPFFIVKYYFPPSKIIRLLFSYPWSFPAKLQPLPSCHMDIFELSTHKNLPLDMSQALYTLHTLGCSQLFSAGSSHLAAGTRNLRHFL